MFGLEPITINTIAIAITALLAIIEGLRRIFQLEQRWISKHAAMMDLRWAVRKYRLSTLGTTKGDDQWRSALLELLALFEAATEKERQVFYQGLRALSQKEGRTKSSR